LFPQYAAALYSAKRCSVVMRSAVASEPVTFWKVARTKQNIAKSMIAKVISPLRSKRIVH
jgi:hypothetical protein